MGKEIPFRVQTLPHDNPDETCEDRLKRIAHQFELDNEALIEAGKPEVGYTLMCREIPHG